MSRTYRVLRPKTNVGRYTKSKLVKLTSDKLSVRDGTHQHISKSCRNHGGCPICEGNRTHKFKKQTIEIEYGDEYGDEYE